MNKLILVALSTAGLAGTFYLGLLTAPQMPSHGNHVIATPPVASTLPVAIETPIPTQPITQTAAPSSAQPSYQRDWLQLQSLLGLA